MIGEDKEAGEDEVEGVEKQEVTEEQKPKGGKAGDDKEEE